MAKIRVSGKILKEVSQNIPNAQLALTELIKNSYEAGAASVSVNISAENITIKDNGTGISSKNIDSLLNISHSDKVFGTKINGRYVSGEKGLGFFSVFKFGNHVKVKTSDPDHNGDINSFSLDMEILEKQTDISTFDVPIIPEHNDDLRGTIISISKLDTETVKIFKDSLQDEGESSRLLNIIHDPKFSVQLSSDGQTAVNDTEPSDKFEQSKIAQINYTSKKDGKVNHQISIHMGTQNAEKIIPISFGNKYDRVLSIPDLHISFDIDVYSLSGAKTTDAPKLYFFSKGRRLTPIIYINDVMFEDPNFYDIEINAATSGRLVFRQQTGKILIYLDKPDILAFNSDRTKIIESNNYKDLVNFSNFISSEAQKKIRSLRDDLKKKETDSALIGNSGNQQQTQSKDDSRKSGISGSSAQEADSQDTNGDPSIKLVRTKFKVAMQYNFDDLIEIKDSMGGTAIKPSKFKIVPESGVFVDKTKQNLVFYIPGSFNISLSFMDKRTRHEKDFSQDVLVVSQNQTLSKKSKEWIQSLVPGTGTDKIDDLINRFKAQINELMENDKYDVVLVSSLRTFIELIVRSIGQKIGIDNAESIDLKKLYEQIISSCAVRKFLLDNLGDSRNQEGISVVFTEIQSKERFGSLIDFLNLTTHAATTMLGLPDVKSKALFFRFLYTYLVVVSKPRK